MVNLKDKFLHIKLHLKNVKKKTITEKNFSSLDCLASCCCPPPLQC